MDKKTHKIHKNSNPTKINTCMVHITDIIQVSDY